MRALSLFSGIGGLDIAASWAGIETALFCEIEPYACEVLKRRWPDVENVRDIRYFSERPLRELGGSPYVRFKTPADYRGTIDVVHGGFPCQDLSVAGKQAGLTGARSGLWFEMLRVIAGIRPRYVVAENVRGAVNLALDTVCSGLGDEGYEVRPFVLPASAFGAPHRRDRVFILGIRQDVADSFTRDFKGANGDAHFSNRDRPAHEPVAQCGEGSGNLCPTPHRNCSNGAGQHGEGGLNLQTAASLWATPSIVGNYNRKGCSIKAGDGLATQVGKLGPTMTAGASGSGKLCGGSGHWQMLKDGVGIELARKMGARNGGQLNPAWVEILMGCDVGWTDVDCDEPEPWPGWPALMGSDQYPYEPPRTVTGCKNRAKRLKCLGNSVVPQQAYPIFRAIAEMEAMAP